MSEKPTSEHQAGGLLFAALFFVFAAWLLSQIGAETKFSSSGVLFAQPRFWPAVGVVGMLGFGLGHVIQSFRDRAGNTRHEAQIWLRAIEYLAWFMIYVWLVPVIGYLAATIAFTVCLSLRQGYRGAKNIFIAAATGFAIVLIFKTGLSVKIPGGAIYESLPDGLRSFMIVNF